MIRKKVLSIGSNSATLLVQDTEANGALRVLRRLSVTGWADDDVKMVEEAYETLRKARLRGFLPIHTILVQSSFLSVVSSYAPEGDVSTFLEEEVDSPLEEQMVLRWLCACALSIREMQIHKLYFPGLTPDRLFLDHQTGGTAQILLGVPLPLPVYIAQMQERRRNGIKVSLDYPPEVLAEPNWSFHGTMTDVWCLGRLAEVLLTAKGTSLARRSGSTRQLVARMMNPEPAKRPSMESVAQSLIALAGNVKLGQPQWPPVSAKATSAATVQSPPPPPQPAPQASQPPPPVTTPRRQVPSASNHSVSSKPPSSRTSSPPPNVPATRSHDSRKKPDAAAPTPTSTATSSPLVQSVTHLDAAARPLYAPDDSWHQRARQQFEQLQRLNASPQKARGGGDAPASPRGGNGERRRGSREDKSPSPRRGARGSGVVDHNTRMLDEMFAEQAAQQRNGNRPAPPRRSGHNVEELQQLEAEAQRQMKLETAQRHHEMRRHFTEWQRQNNQRYTDAGNALVMEQDGVVIVAPKPTPPPGQTPVASPPPPPPTAALSAPKPTPGVASPVRKPQSVTSPNGPVAEPLPAMLTSSSRTYSPRGIRPRPKTPSTASPLRRATPKAAQSSGLSPQSSVTTSAGGLTSTAVPNRGSASPRPANASALSSVTPQARKSSEGVLRPQPAAPASSTAAEGPAAADRSAPRRLSADPSTLSAVEWSVDGIRSTLRSLLRNRDLYGDVMQEVAVFVSQTEEARLSARSNEIFMQRLRKLMREERVFFSAAPLCAQLVALEGLDHTLRGTSSVRPSR